MAVQSIARTAPATACSCRTSPRFHLDVRAPKLARIAELRRKYRRPEQRAAAERSIAAVDRLRARIGIPARPAADSGVTQEMLPAFAEKAASIVISGVNPARVAPGATDVLGVYQPPGKVLRQTGDFKVRNIARSPIKSTCHSIPRKSGNFSSALRQGDRPAVEQLLGHFRDSPAG